MTEKKKPSVEQYRLYIWQFGILTTIYLLEHFEALENYEQCDLIMKAIKCHENKLGIKLFSRETDECMKSVIDSYHFFGMTGENAKHNSEYYKDYILAELQL